MNSCQENKSGLVWIQFRHLSCGKELYSFICREKSDIKFDWKFYFIVDENQSYKVDGEAGFLCEVSSKAIVSMFFSSFRY